VGEGGRALAAMSDHDLEALKLTYTRLRDESGRLRNARAYFARGLGPAPASAGIATAVAAAVGSDQNRGWVYAALVLLALMVGVGALYGGKRPYRQLYADRVRQGKSPGPAELAELSEKEWYLRMIELERALYGEELVPKNRLLLPQAEISDLQAGADAERTGALVVQALWVAVIACLVLSKLV
jgi:hypothetical protein